MNIFDVDCERKDAAIVILPVPWEATTSYGQGTAYGPELILRASAQQDLYDFYFKDNYKAGFFWQNHSEEILESSFTTRKLCELAMQGDKQALAETNKHCAAMNEYVYKNCLQILEEDKIPAVVGGDHSTPLGLIRAIGEKYQGDYGILHIDAHADLRKAYQGFTYSHASIFYNVMTSDFLPKKLVQVGIRDYCEEEALRIEQSEGRIHTFFDAALKERESWRESCEEIAAALPERVYLSVDIDGFDPKLCPNTGTPVPGGLDFWQFQQLLHVLVGSGKKIIGFDLNEVSAGPEYDLEQEWDGNVGMRILFQLCGWCVESQKQKIS